MQTKWTINLHKLSQAVNLLLPSTALFYFLLGTYFSFYFHYLTVFFLYATLVNFSYRHIQTEHTLLRNFGILGQGRYMLESLGPELRQYLFSNDLEERPFNREERNEVYRKANNDESSFSFGSQQEYDASEIKLRHSMFPIDKEEVEPYSLTFGEHRQLGDRSYTITQPAMISAMSYGALSSNAVRALARGAAKAGIPINTGEGGYPKYHLMENADLIFQMGTAKFGVRHEDGRLDEDALHRLSQEPAIKMIEIKFSQGAKPGKGGLLPKEKISPEVAELRGVPMDRDIVSPSHHRECTDPFSTVNFIRHIQEVSGLPTGIKLCVGSLDQLYALMAEMNRQKIYPDYIAVDGAEGGTGAAPKSFLDYVGMPLWPALFGVHKIMTELNMLHQTHIIAGGKLINPGRQLTAMCLGARALYTARGFMLALGCIQALQCGRNTCPIGITSHDPSLMKGLIIEPASEKVAHYARQINREFYEFTAAMGCRSFQEFGLQHLIMQEGTILYDETKAFYQSQLI